MLRTALAGSLLALLTACASTPVPLSEAKPVPADRLFAFQSKTDSASRAIVTRDTSFQGGGCYLGVFIDGTLAGKVDPGEVASFHLPAGEHLIGVGTTEGRGLCAFSTDLRREITANFPAGRTSYYRIVTRSEEGPALEATSLR